MALQRGARIQGAGKTLTKADIEAFIKGEKDLSPLEVRRVREWMFNENKRMDREDARDFGDAHEVGEPVAEIKAPVVDIDPDAPIPGALNDGEMENRRMRKILLTMSEDKEDGNSRIQAMKMLREMQKEAPPITTEKELWTGLARVRAERKLVKEAIKTLGDFINHHSSSDASDREVQPVPDGGDTPSDGHIQQEAGNDEGSGSPEPSVAPGEAVPPA